ncbi:glycoside hydrolase family 97 N-terminal domain-containing protein, partial [Bacteroides heparinolyticus]|uniref:glycoside hydrolase family 97 N-terminal domain-containing protein n=1 Tax=Prevotella heparinolytica TaxID=28113 RepID=UPI00359F1D55
MKNSICLKSIVISLLYLGHNPLGATSEKNYILVSPNGKLKVEIIATGGLSYRVTHEIDTILSLSKIGMVAEEKNVTANHSFQVIGIQRRKIVDKIEALREFIVSCNELNLRLNSNFGVIFRSYDEGIAYRFYSTRKAEVCIKGEIAEFNFQRNYTAYLPYTTKDREPLAMAFQNFYNITPLSSAVQKPTFLPVTIDCGKVKLTLLEAD